MYFFLFDAFVVTVKVCNFIEKIMQNIYLERITIHPDVCHGKPCVRNMRWTVEIILDMLCAEMTVQEILEDHPELEREDIIACLQYAKLLAMGTVLPLQKAA